MKKHKCSKCRRKTLVCRGCLCQTCANVGTVIIEYYMQDKYHTSGDDAWRYTNKYCYANEQQALECLKNIRECSPVHLFGYVYRIIKKITIQEVVGRV